MIDDPESDTGDVHVALLRGINLGGKNRLPMEDLRAIFRNAGCRDVATYIQSGNVVFRARGDDARRVPGRVKAAIAERFGHDVPVVTRALDELEDAAASNPFLDEEPDPKALHVMFLADTPDEDQVDSLDPDRSPGDRFVVRGREIFLHCPDGVARTKLTNQYFDSRLDTTSTSRNWRTVNKLLAMARDA